MAADSTPSGYHIDAADLPRVERYARGLQLLAEDEPLVSAAKAGEGNMNLTLRLATTERSFIVKQARPWVEKYPQIEAPAERALVEIAFYRAVAARPAVAGAMPQLLATDPDNRVLVLEDLGDARDMTRLYSGEELSGNDLRALVDYLKALHRPFELDAETRHILANRKMRSLNHTHIFDLPLAERNGLDLDAITPGLGEAAATLRRDGDYVARVRALGKLYLEDGEALVHGDYFPGSWLRTASGPKIIDPEFCFLGDPAFDLGVMLAHLHLARLPAELEEALFEAYGDDSLRGRARQFAGCEIMRRLIGVAQLPLACGIEKKTSLLNQSRQLVQSGDSP